MYELYLMIDGVTQSFGFFTSEWIQQAKEDLQRCYLKGKVWAEERECDVLRISQEIDYNEYK